MHLRLVPDTPPPAPPTNAPWMRRVLAGAAAFNVVWAAVAIAAPAAPFDWLGLTPPSYTGLWRAVGAIVAAHGVGYALAAFDPLARWPLTVVGLLGKVLVPTVVVIGSLQGDLPWRLATTVGAAAVVWWIPLALILAAAWRAHHHHHPTAASAERLPSRKRA